eukprot:gene41493-50635_t
MHHGASWHSFLAQREARVVVLDKRTMSGHKIKFESMADDNAVEIVEYEEVPQPHVIETGDSVKVKQVLDECIMETIGEAGYAINYSWDNFKLLLMFVACVFALVAQFYPMPFPASRPLLAVCCAMYFIISSVLQFIVTFIDKDTIMFTKPNE